MSSEAGQRPVKRYRYAASFLFLVLLSRPSNSLACYPGEVFAVSDAFVELAEDVKKAIPPPTSKTAAKPPVKPKPVSKFMGPVKPELQHRFYISPDKVRKYDSRTLATLMLQRLHDECDVTSKPTDKDEKEIGEDSEIVMMINSNILPSNAIFGFNNQHMTSSTHGCSCTDMRFNTEQELAMTELPYSNKGRELLPKYSAFNVKRTGFGTYSLPAHYGNTALIFKPSVKARTTWTYEDSLNSNAGQVGIRGFSNPSLTHTNQYKRDAKDINVCMGYCEAQIWGKLDLTDVDAILVKDTSAITSDMKMLGVPIYQLLDTSSSTQAAQFSKGPLLFSPDKSAKAPKILTEAELQVIVKSYPGTSTTLTADQNIVASKLMEFVSDDQLNSKDSIDALTSPSSGGHDTDIDRSLFGLGELAARKKTPESIQSLEKIFDNGAPIAKTLALYGLSEIPWGDLKPRVITALSSTTSPPLVLLGIAIAADHPEDTDIQNALRDLRKSPMMLIYSPIKEHLERLNKKHFCDLPEPTPSPSAS